jgi:GNAT superfamily N-acetyltransferase
MMEITIRRGEARDVPAILQLIKELATFERAPEAVWNTEADLLKDGFGEAPFFYTFVAELPDGEVVGLAMYHWAYSSWKGKYLYLDDLYVKEKIRGSGIGKKLLDAFLSEAKALDANMVKWQVLHWNEPAIKMYEKHGVTFDNEWIDCKLFYPRQS